MNCFFEFGIWNYELSLYLSTNRKMESKINDDSMQCFSSDCMNNSPHPNHIDVVPLCNTLTVIFHGYKV